MQILSSTVRDRLAAVADRAGAPAHEAAAQLLATCGGLAPAALMQYEAPVRVARPLLDGLQRAAGGLSRAQAARALVAAAALKLDATFAGHRLPASVLALMPAAVERVLQTLAEDGDAAYDEDADLYRKDLRFVTGQCVPCGAQDVDLFAAAPWTTLLKNPVPSKIGRYLAARGTGVWFRIHTDPRNTGDFDEAGWRRCYHRIADLLQTRPDVRGMVGTSWFYDPQLLTISPRLAYLQVDPLEGGAFMLRNGPGAIHTQRATATSPSRRKLHEEGKYLPVCWSVLWPRRELLAWAAARSRDGV